MGILSKGLDRIKKFNAARKERAVARLLNETGNAQRRFISEAKRLGIEVSSYGMRSYYEAIGIKYTNDQKVIKEAYVKMIKKYHPDLSKEKGATQITEEINEAYATLRNAKAKVEYDTKFSKGAIRMSAATAKGIANELLRRYYEDRARDFAEFNKRVATPQQRDSIKAAIEETANWDRRFSATASAMFGRFWDYGKGLKRLQSANSGMLKHEADGKEQKLLQDNLARLEGLVNAYNDAEKGIAAITANARSEIAAQESSLADRLRGSFQ